MTEGRKDVLYAAGAVVLTFAAWLAFRSNFALAGLAQGSDPVLWTLASKNLGIGAPSPLPPLFPGLMALLERISGAGTVEVGLFLSGLAAWLLPGAVFLLARSLGAERPGAGIAAGFTLVFPRIVEFAFQLQPDSLIALLLVATVPVVSAWLTAPTTRRLALLALWAAVVSQTREHGLVLAAVLVPVALLPAAPPLLRLLRPAAVVLAVVLAPVLTLQAPVLPHLSPWMARITMAVGGKEPQVLGIEPNFWVRAHIDAHTANARVKILLLHAEHSLEVAWCAWGFIFLAVIAALRFPRERRLAAVVPLFAVAPALVIYSEARHVFVALPVALGVAAAGLSATGRRLLWIVAAGASFATVGMEGWPSAKSRMGQSSAWVDRQMGERLCAAMTPGDLMAGNTDYATYCPVRQSAVDPRVRNASDWRTWLIGDLNAVRQGDWQPVLELDRGLYAWRLLPHIDGPSRPCSGSLAAPDTPYVIVPPVPAVMVPDCGGTTAGGGEGAPLRPRP